MPIPRAYLKLSVPVVFAMVLNVVYNMVDTWFISLTGDPDLVAGVSICSPIFVLSIALGDIWGLGGSSLMSRLLGEKRDEEAGGVSAFCLYTAFGIGLVFMAFLFLLQNPLLRLLGANEASLPHASAYYSWIAAGTPFIILSLVPNNHLRTEGLSSLGMWCAISGSIANIILDPILIFSLHMGAAGAALATTLSNILTCALYILIIRKKCNVMNLQIKKTIAQANRIREILRIGIPASITNLMFSLSMMLTNRALASYGNTQIAAMGIAMRVNMLCQMTLIGFAFGAQPLFGYNYGSKNGTRFRKTLRFAYLFALCLGVFFAILLFLLAPFLMKCFIDDPQVINAGVKMLQFMQISSLIVGIPLVSTCVCQAVGHALGALILSLCRQGILFFISISLLPLVFDFNGILLTQPVSDFLTAILSLVIIFQILRRISRENVVI